MHQFSTNPQVVLSARVAHAVGVLPVANPVLFRTLIGRRASEIGISADRNLRKAVDGSGVVKALYTSLLIEIRSLERAAKVEIASVIRNACLVDPIRAEDMGQSYCCVLSPAMKRESPQGNVWIGIVLIVVIDRISTVYLGCRRNLMVQP